MHLDVLTRHDKVWWTVPAHVAAAQRFEHTRFSTVRLMCPALPVPQIGRVSRMRGDGTLELTSMAGPSKPAVPVAAEDNINTFSLQTFTDLDSVQWDRSSTLTKLVTIATVCNKAKFVYPDTDACRCLCDHAGPRASTSTFECGSQPPRLLCCPVVAQPARAPTTRP